MSTPDSWEGIPVGRALYGHCFLFSIESGWLFFSFDRRMTCKCLYCKHFGGLLKVDIHV